MYHRLRAITLDGNIRTTSLVFFTYCLLNVPYVSAQTWLVPGTRVFNNTFTTHTVFFFLASPRRERHQRERCTATAPRTPRGSAHPLLHPRARPHPQPQQPHPHRQPHPSAATRQRWTPDASPPLRQPRPLPAASPPLPPLPPPPIPPRLLRGFPRWPFPSPPRRGGGQLGILPRRSSVKEAAKAGARPATLESQVENGSSVSRGWR